METLILEFGKFFLKLDGNHLHVTHNAPMVQILDYVTSDPTFVYTVVGNRTEVDSVVFHTADSCEPLTVNLFPPQLSVPVVEPDCFMSRSPSLLGTFNFHTGRTVDLNVDVLQKKLKSSKTLSGLAIETQELNSNLFFLYNLDPQKNIVLDRDYWEKLTILASVDGDNVTLIIDSLYAGGFFPPHPSEFRRASTSFHEELYAFYLKLKKDVTD